MTSATNTVPSIPDANAAAIDTAADPLHADFNAPADPLNAELLAAIAALDVGAVRRLVAQDPGRSRLPGPRGSDPLAAVFTQVVQTQVQPPPLPPPLDHGHCRSDV